MRDDRAPLTSDFSTPFVSDGLAGGVDGYGGGWTVSLVAGLELDEPVQYRADVPVGGQLFAGFG